MGKILTLQVETAGGYVDMSTVTVVDLFNNMDGYNGDSKKKNFKVVLADDGLSTNTVTSFKNVMLGFSLINSGTKIKLETVNDTYVCSKYVYEKKIQFGVTKELIDLTPDSNGLFLITTSLDQTTSEVIFSVTNKILERLVTNYGDIMTLNNLYFDMYAIPN